MNTIKLLSYFCTKINLKFIIVLLPPPPPLDVSIKEDNSYKNVSDLNGITDFQYYFCFISLLE